MPDVNAAYLAYRAGAETARRLPVPLGRVLARAASRAMLVLWRERRQQVRRNLRQVLGPDATDAAVAAATERMFDNYARYWHELFRLDGTDPGGRDEILAKGELVGAEHLDAATGGPTSATPQGAILALPHLGNWDLAGAWLAARGHRLVVAAEPIEPPALFEWFVETRRRLGMEVVGLGPDAAGKLLGALEDGALVCLVCDRDLSGDGVEVELFGAPARVPRGPVLLALRAGVPLLPSAAGFLPGGRQRVSIGAPLELDRRGRLRDDVERLTQDLVRHFEERIAAHPDQWLVMQPVWSGHQRRATTGAEQGAGRGTAPDAGEGP